MADKVLSFIVGALVFLIVALGVANSSKEYTDTEGGWTDYEKNQIIRILRQIRDNTAR